MINQEEELLAEWLSPEQVARQLAGKRELKLPQGEMEDVDLEKVRERLSERAEGQH